MKFSKFQRAGLRFVPEDRLLIETDAPYFYPAGASGSTPTHIGQTALLVSQVRRESLQVLATRVVPTVGETVNIRNLDAGCMKMEPADLQNYMRITLIQKTTGNGSGYPFGEMIPNQTGDRL